MIAHSCIDFLASFLASAWDSEAIDHWKIDSYTEEESKGNTLIDETVFSTLFPKYREAYLREVWCAVTAELKKYVRLSSDV